MNAGLIEEGGAGSRNKLRHYNQLKRAEAAEEMIMYDQLLIIFHSKLEAYCKEYGVKMLCPQNVERYLQNVNQWIMNA
jgi:hypothetical protein